jgi:hypothetical protein
MKLRVCIVKDLGKEPEHESDWREVVVELTPEQVEVLSLKEHEIIFGSDLCISERAK